MASIGELLQQQLSSRFNADSPVTAGDHRFKRIVPLLPTLDEKLGWRMSQAGNTILVTRILRSPGRIERQNLTFALDKMGVRRHTKVLFTDPRLIPEPIRRELGDRKIYVLDLTDEMKGRADNPMRATRYREHATYRRPNRYGGLEAEFLVRRPYAEGSGWESIALEVTQHDLVRDVLTLDEKHLQGRPIWTGTDRTPLADLFSRFHQIFGFTLEGESLPSAGDRLHRRVVHAINTSGATPYPQLVDEFP